MLSKIQEGEFHGICHFCDHLFTAIEIKITGVKKLQINNFGRELIRDKSSRMCLWTMVVLRKKKLNCLQSDFNRPKI